MPDPVYYTSTTNARIVAGCGSHCLTLWRRAPHEILRVSPLQIIHSTPRGLAFNMATVLAHSLQSLFNIETTDLNCNDKRL